MYEWEIERVSDLYRTTIDSLRRISQFWRNAIESMEYIKVWEAYCESVGGM